MEFDWKQSPLFVKYAAICWDNDKQVQQNQIIDEGISSHNPVERAYWLLMKAQEIGSHPDFPDYLNRAWDTVETALPTAMAPELHQLRTHVLITALVLATLQGPTHRLANVVRQMRPGVIRYLREPVVRYDIAVLCETAGRFRQAKTWFDRAFQVHYLDLKSPLGKINALSMRAWVCALLGRPELGAADLAEARRLYDQHGEGRVRMYSQTMAETWMALRQGRLQEARAFLQEHMIQSHWRTHPLHIFQSHVLAARLALAEGSQAGYRHYCDQARAVCEQNDLTLSRQFLKVVMADAEREFGPVDPA